MAIAPSARRLRRFSRTERALHWVHASAFFVLFGSGLCLYLPSLAQLVGRRPLLKDIHAYTALAWLAALALVVLAGDRRRLLADAREIDVFDDDDLGWLRRRGNPQGRFNAGQKINVIVTAALAFLFALTGFFLWYGERNHAFRLQNALVVHDWLMYISFFLVLGHLYLSLVNPSTRHSLSGITRGWVREDWALKHDAKWARAVARRDGRLAVAVGALEPGPGGVESAARGGARAAVTGWLAADAEHGWLSERAMPRFFSVPYQRQAVLGGLAYDLYSAEISVEANRAGKPR